MKLRRSSEAQRNLANILEYIAVEQQNPIAAWDVLERIERTFEVLLDQPQIGRRSERPNTRAPTLTPSATSHAGIFTRHEQGHRTRLHGIKHAQSIGVWVLVPSIHASNSKQRDSA